MADENKEEIKYNTTIGSPLSSLLRSLYLHGVEQCALASDEGYSVYSKDQIVSLLERGNADTKVSDAIALLSSNTFSGVLEKRLLEPLTPVLLVTDTGVEVVPAGKISHPRSREADATPPEDRTPAFPSWWEIPLPLADCTGKHPLLNSSAEELLGGFILPSFPRRKRHPGEFLLELQEKNGKKGKRICRQYLFTEVAYPVFLIQDVTEDLRNAERMAWMASIGQAFISDLKCKGKTVRQIRSPECSVEEESGTHLACIWEEKLLGYICIDEGSSE